MALNPNAVGRRNSECTETDGLQSEGGEPPKNSTATSATANQNGDQTGCGDSAVPQHEATERRRSVQADARSFSSSPSPGQRPNFQIPRKTRERKGLYHDLPPDSREFEELLKTVSSCYLDSSSRGAFSYCKARLIRNELLEKEFIEKRREMKQEGRTEQELTESFCFLYPDKSKLQWICEKGLMVGHSRITTLGSPSVGVYLSKFSDLLQINPFEVGSSGDMVVFKVMKGRIKHIHENVPKNAIEPSPKFDGHLSKSANRVTSLLSYRAFELTQQYFFEFAFDEIKPRPRHVCPYAVISFQYKGKETAATALTAQRLNTIHPEGSRGKSCYTVWSGLLVNKEKELFPMCLRSSSRPYLPFKLPDKLEMNRGMQLEQVKRKIPPVLFSWDTYSVSREVKKFGMSCSIFQVVDGKGKPTNGTVAALVNKLERDRMVLVKSLFDRGFLFLLSSSQMVESKERWGRLEKSLQALFIFQESRMVVKYSSKLFEPEPLTVEPQPAILSSVESFIPALHYGLFKLRPNPGKDVSSGVERQATDYLTRMNAGTVRPFVLPDYRFNMDDRINPVPVPRPKFNMDSVMRAYIHNPANYMLPLNKAKDIIERIRNPAPAPTPVSATVEYSPVSDWGGSDRGSDRPERLAERPPQERPPQERPPQERPPQERPPQERPPQERPPQERLPQERPPQERPPQERLLQERPPQERPPLERLSQERPLPDRPLPDRPLPDRPPPDRPAQDKPPDSSKQRPGVSHSNGAQAQHKSHTESQPQPPHRLRLSQNEYDEDKMKQLLKLIQLHKKALVKDPGKERGEDGALDVSSLKRKFEGDDRGGMNKHPRTDSQSNGEPSRGVQADEIEDEGGHRDKLTAVMESMGIYDTDLRARGNTSASAVNETQRLLKILLATLNKAVAHGSVPAQSNHGESSTGSRWVEPDPDLRKQHEPASQTNYAEEDMDCSPGSPLSAGSPLVQVQTSDDPTCGNAANEEKAQPFPEPMLEPEPEMEPATEALTDSHPEPSTPAAVEVKNVAAPPTLAVVEEAPFLPSISLDTILNQEIRSLTSDIRNIMQTHHICYTSQLPPRLPLRHRWLPNSCFSGFVVPYVTPVPVQGHVKALCEKMDKLIPPPPPPPKVPSPTPPVTTSNLTPPPTPIQASKAKAEASLWKSAATSQTGKTAAKAKTEAQSSDLGVEVYSPSGVTPESPDSNSQNPGHASGSESGLLAGSLIGQLKPEVFSSLVEIFKDVTKNTVKFYIYSADEGEESAICKEIKGYLKSLGNSECSPQSFLENSSRLDKLLIIIQNEDIAGHVHKIPALVSLKKLPSVSFAGVDTLDDVKNHTYNELFVSGGFIVSDEFVLNPDLITQDRLQGLLKFLEEQSTPEHPWQWKVHCKSQKKLKELGRLNTNAMGLLNLLTAYQKKHLVEFLPYHECDTQSRQAPDLECLIKLQAQHTQQRHLIFLTERPFEMFLQYSRNGIVIGSIDDVMSGFHSLIGSINQNEVPTPPSTVMNDECVEEEDMSLDSDDGEPATVSDPSATNQGAGQRKPPLPPPPETEEFRPPLPEQQATPERPPTLSDCSALKAAISQFKATNQISLGSSDMDSLSPGGFPVNPHQSFLCPSASWSYTGSSSYAVSPAYPASPCGSTHEQEYRHQPTAPPPPVIAAPRPLANLASLPLEVKPPPPPHLMMLGQTYGSDNGGAGVAGNSPLIPSFPYSDHNDSAQPGYMAGIPTDASENPMQQDRPGEGVWGGSDTTTCETASSQGVVTSGPGKPSGLPTMGETLGGSTPGSQGARTQVDCFDNLGATVGIPALAARGGSIVRPKLPQHLMSGVGYGSIGGISGQMDHRPMRGGMGLGPLGSFRGRGVSPGGVWHQPGRGYDRGVRTGGGACSWGYPAGRGGAQDYYSDYSYSHNYAPE